MNPSTLRKSFHALAVASGIGAAGAAGAPPPSHPVGTVSQALAEDLAGATGLLIDGDVSYENGTPPALWNAIVGLRVVFSARTAPGAPRDVYRATLRATPGGTLLAVRQVVNLTDTSLGDDGPLISDGSRFAFVTRAFGVVQSATVLDFATRSTAPDALTGLRRAVTDLQSTGGLHAPVRWDLRLDRPVHDLTLSLSGAVLTARGDGHTWRADTLHDDVSPGLGATLVRQESVDKPLLIWAVDTVRGLSWVGPTPITWLEAQVFGARDVVHRLAYRWWGHAPERASEETFVPADPGEATVLSTQGSTVARDPWWPPPAVHPPLADPEPHEGTWVTAAPAWVRRLPGAPPAFYKTFVRLDPERPYARVVLAAMDLRQLELGMQAGTEDPVPLVGPHGDGRIPRTQGLMPRVVAAFNGAFKTEHGAYGMMVNHRVLLPPQPNAATVAVLDDDRVAMGTWGPTDAIPAAIVSLRQNLDPLVADGVENPTHRALWGYVIGGIESMPTVRSGLCDDGHGHLIYAWGEETTARMLAHAMRLAGCTYGMHLDMNPTHAVFHFLRVDDLATHRMQFQQLATGMQSGTDRFVYYTLKDFFYLALRDDAPAPVHGVAWTPAPASAQPAPTWLPTVFTVHPPVPGSQSVELTSLPLDRVGFRVGAGRAETYTGLPPSAPPDDPAVVLSALELGAAPPRTPQGLMVAGRVVIPFSDTTGHVAFSPPGGISLAPSGLPSPEARDALQGSTLVRDSAAVATLETTVRPMAAVGVTEDHRAIIARGDVSPRDLAAVLCEAGVHEAIALERGVGEPTWHTAEDPIRAGYAGTTLYVLAREAPSPVISLGAVAPGAVSQ